MSYIGTKPADQILDSTLIADGTILTADLANGAVTSAKMGSGAALSNLGTSQLAKANMPAGSVLQVASATKTDTFTSSTTGSWLDVTGLSITITPTSSSNKVMVFARITGMGTNAATRLHMRLVRDTTAISVGDASSSRLQVSNNELYINDNEAYLGSAMFFLDAPATTATTTYKIQIRNSHSTGTLYVNRSVADSDAGSTPRGTSSITVMEIAG